MKKHVTFAILKEDTPSTDHDLRTKLKPGVYMGFIGDPVQDTIKMIIELEDDVLYQKELDWLNEQIEAEHPGKSLPPMSKEERMARAQEFRLEIGVGVDEVLTLTEGDFDE